MGLVGEYDMEIKKLGGKCHTLVCSNIVWVDTSFMLNSWLKLSSLSVVIP